MGRNAPINEGAFFMSEETNPQNNEPTYLQVFSSGTGKQLNSNALEGAEPRFELEKIAVQCSTYAEGHHFHWIPIFRYSEPRLKIKARWLEEDKFEIMTGSHTVIWRHHDPERLKAALAQAIPEDIKRTQGRPWIFIETGNGAYAFNCADEEMVPCVTPTESK